MIINNTNEINDYINQLPESQMTAVKDLHESIISTLPEGFDGEFKYGMISYVVPHSVYPEGYHCNPKDALPFMSLAARKNFIALYHMGLYVNQELMDWFKSEYAKQVTTKLDMGKSCIRFKKPEQIPVELIGELCSKMSPQDWISIYEAVVKK